MKNSLCLIAVLFPFAVFGQWNLNDNNTSTGNLLINGIYATTSNYALIFESSGDAIIKKNTAGNIVICSYPGTSGSPAASDIRFNYGYGGGTGGISIYDGVSDRNANLKITANGHLVISPSGYLGNPGNVGIGTTGSIDSKLTVAGDIRAREIRVTITAGSDFVFQNDYDLKTLQDVENFIKQYGHLPDIMPATEMEENGIELGKMDMKLLQKIEELTLYLIEQNKKIESLQTKIKELENVK